MTPEVAQQLQQVDTQIGKVWTIKGDEMHLGVINEVIVRDTYRVKELHDYGFQPNVIVDLGANIGTFTLMASYYFPKAIIFSFEPNAGHFHFLTLNCADKATILKTAVLGYPTNPMPSRDEEATWRKTHGAGISVNLMREITGTPDLIKMDVEGSEVNILSEMVDLKMTGWIPVVVGEWHFQPAKTVVKETLSPTHDVTFGPADRGYDWDTFHAFHRHTYPVRCKT